MRLLGFLVAGLCGVVGCGSVQDRPDAMSIDAMVSNVDASPPGFCDPGDSHLVACYAFEPASPATTLADGSATHNDGSLGGVTFVGGHVGMAVQVTPATSRIVVPDSASLDVTSVTIETFLNTDTVVGTGARAGILDNDGQYGLFIKPGNVIECTLSGSTGLLLDTTVSIDVNAWVHVACTYDGASKTGAVYLNGAKVTMGTGTAPLSTAGTAGIAIGANSPCTAAPCSDAFSGVIDQMRIFDVARSASDICRDAGGSGGSC